MGMLRRYFGPCLLALLLLLLLATAQAQRHSSPQHIQAGTQATNTHEQASPISEQCQTDPTDMDKYVNMDGRVTMGPMSREGLIDPTGMEKPLDKHTRDGRSYVVYMGSNSPTRRSSAHHVERLSTVVGSSTLASESLIHSYQNFDAFAAKLTPEHAASLAAQEDVVSVSPNRAGKLQTTHSWSFLGLEDNAGKVGPDSLWTKSGFGKDVIIGVVDSGVWPESNSFNDEGLGPIPTRWKGACVEGEQFGPSYCNNKLIGGRYFINGFEAEEGPLNTTATGDYLSPRDSNGHGTHVSSTAGGNFAPGSNSLGFAPGTAKGGAPRSRVAVYKACWPSTLSGKTGCNDADALAAIDQAISDGVEVLALSLAFPTTDFFNDFFIMGTFHAHQHNISVVAGAGNSGPEAGTVVNVAPWITTVAASSVDRDFLSQATLGSGLVINGTSLTQGTLPNKFYPLVSSADVSAAGSNSTASTSCLSGSLDPEKVSGKIVACTGLGDQLAKGQVVKDAGGIGMILAYMSPIHNDLLPEAHVLPTSAVLYEDGLKVFLYINSTQSPVAKISGGSTVLGVKPAPVLASFSSRGPNALVPDLLKPDITAPGLNILAAWPEAHPITALLGDNRIVKYNVIFGTSMSCPHVAGIVASLKAYHPTWSPAALHSAIVTTGSISDNVGKRITDSAFKNVTTPFGFGGGHVDPNSAAEPGLVYDNDLNAYYEFFCSLGYTTAQIKLISRIDYTCPAVPASVSDFNYPSLTVSRLAEHAVINRSVTNVGNPASVYTVSIESPPGIDVVIKPSVLNFAAVGEVKSFSVELNKLESTGDQYVFGSFTWTDGIHSVRSPLVVRG